VPAPSTPPSSNGGAPPEVRSFVEKMGSLMFETGIPRMPARVFSALLASSSGRMTAAELSAMLDASPAAISGAVRYLIQIGLVARERETGSRRDHFVLHNDVFYELMSQDARALQAWESGIRSGVDAVGEDTPAGRRMLEMLDFFGFLQEEIPAMMQRWKVRRAELHG
jgi:predicted transcriptional regulator